MSMGEMVYKGFLLVFLGTFVLMIALLLKPMRDEVVYYKRKYDFRTANGFMYFAFAMVAAQILIVGVLANIFLPHHVMQIIVIVEGLTAMHALRRSQKAVVSAICGALLFIVTLQYPNCFESIAHECAIGVSLLFIITGILSPN